ncbi:MAG: hypothetical protein ISS47_09585 [Candidatus Omnitrophica bacterium]|nr:hypothetical protein [Candidatus Omnitrophota bacterium]
MADQIKIVEKNIEKMWPEVKDKLYKIGKDALELAKYGERKVIKLSKKSKLQFELVTLQLKREHLYYKLGKETFSLLKKGVIKNKKLKSIYNLILNLNKNINSSKINLKK